MEDRAPNGKLNVGKKANRFLVYVFLTLMIFILLQFLTFEKKWHGLDTTFGTWKAVSSAHLHFSSIDMAKAPERQLDPELLRQSLRKAALCIPRAFAEKGDITGTEVKCLKEVLSASLHDDPVLESTLSTNSGSHSVESGEVQNNATEPEVSRELEVLRNELELVQERLRQSVTMMTLKDMKEPGLSKADTNWFMSSLHGKPEDGNREEFRFPSDISQGKLLCVQGNHTSNGTMNKYGFAWKGYLPADATLLPGLTLVADNYWDYVNPWHSMSAVLNFAAWHADNGCIIPARIVAYHWGEVVTKMGDWITNVMHASLGKRLKPETLSQGTVCFEDAIVHRRGLGGMSKQNMNRLFDMVRCKVHKFCKMSAKSYFLDNKDGKIDLTILARSGPREFKNLSAVVAAVSDQCKLVKGCQLHVVSISNLSFCEQVEIMGRTDILLTSHGAQLTNMMFMPRGGSVMEMFPKGWLELAGVGQYIYSWLTDWTGLNHEGTWRDPEGPDCPYPTTEELKCFLFYKDRPLGLNQTHLSIWTADVLQRIQVRKEKLDPAGRVLNTHCSCDGIDDNAAPQ